MPRVARRPPPLRLLLWRARTALLVLTVLAVGAVLLEALRTEPEPTVPVPVLARALPAGTVLETRDVRTERWPARLAPPLAAEPVGRSLAVTLPAGAPLLEGVLRSEDRWRQAPPGTVAAPVRLADPHVAALLAPGDRVDVYALDGPARALARHALVLEVPSPPGSEGLGLLGTPTSGSGLVLLAISPREVEALAEHGAAGDLTAVLVP